MYKGPKCCAGCNRTGTEAPRHYVDSLCELCKDMIKLGRITKEQNALESEWITLRIFRWSIWDGQIGEANKLWTRFYELCESISRKEKRAPEMKRIGVYNSHGSLDIIITPAQVECIEMLYRQFETSLEAIYTRGKQEGSNLLISLNNGQITLDKFNESLK